MKDTLKKQFREIFENEYPGMETLREKLIKPLWADIGTPSLDVTDVTIEQKDTNKISKITVFANQNSDINFVDVELSDSVILKNNRVTINRYITNKIVDVYQSALIFFHYANNQKEWRISYVYKGDNNSDRTNPKRYTYLCGKGVYCRTAAERFAELETLEGYPDSDAMMKAFSVESLTKEFFNQLFNWYDTWACKVSKFPSKNCIAANAELTTENNQIQLIRLITRLMFVWFIKQKDLIPSWIFDREELQNILSDCDLNSDKKGNYYNAVLQNLFFGALNKKIEDRSFADVSKAGVANEQYGIKTYFRDANEGSFFKFPPKDMVKRFLDVPFLNGGLFECLDWDEPIKNNTSHKVHYVDGFSRDKARRAFIPNILFWNEDDNQPGLITILSRYNFTVEESTPSDVQVALDPELLGKIFENLLGTYNPETRESARKESGSFYTPREIVSYMVNSSIKAYLQEKVPEVNEEFLEKLTNDDKSDDSEIKLSEDQINKIRNSLFEIKIIDPACGSGAFPMGILNKLVEIHVLLDKLSARTRSEHNLYIKKGQFVNYNPDESLKINAEYLGNQEFKLFVNEKEEKSIYKSQDLALHVKEIINKHNKKLGKSTIANLFSQGRIDEGKSFNSIKTKTDIHQIVDEDTNDIIWQYRSYNVKNKFRQYRNEDQSTVPTVFTDDDNDFEYAKYLYSLKTRIIQDSIFGVDIQPIAVQISKLRFFISLICEQPKIENHPEENYGYNPLPNLETKFVAANSLIGKAKKTDDMALFANPRIDEIAKELGEIRKAHFSAKTAQEKKQNREQDEKLRKELSQLLEEEQVYSPEDVKQLAEWNPYDQSAPASSFFDAEWMFGVKDGFDVVIANPPYIPTESIPKDYKKEYEKRYVSAFGRINIYPIFYEQGINLLKENGILSYITPYTILKNKYYIKARSVILTRTSILDLIDFTGMSVFEDAIVDSIILVLKKGFKENNCFNYKSKIQNMNFINQPSTKVSQKQILQNSDLSFSNIGLNFNFLKIYQGCLPIKEVVSFKQGIITGNNKLFISAEKNKLSKKVLTGSDFNKYCLTWPGKYVTYDLTKLHRPRTKEIFETSPKLLLRQTGSYPICMIDYDSYYTLDTVHNGTMVNNNFDIKYVLALINSTLLKFLYDSSINETGKVFAQVKIMYIDPLPLKICSREQQKPIIDLVDKILATKKADFTADTTGLEAEIDRLVYELYGLSDEEIKVVEGR